MNTNYEQFSASSKAAVDSLLTVVSTALQSAERIAALNLSTGRQFMQDSSDAAKALLGAKDVQEAVATQAGRVKPAIEKAVEYTQSLYQISSDARAEMSKLFECQYADFQKSAGALIEQATKHAPAGSEALVSAVKESIAKANSAFETASAMAKGFVETAQNTVESATAKATGKKK